jgi:hypothetical protein
LTQKLQPSTTELTVFNILSGWEFKAQKKRQGMPVPCGKIYDNEIIASRDLSIALILIEFTLPFFIRPMHTTTPHKPDIVC